METKISVNKLAWKLLEKLLTKQSLLGVETSKTESGATIIDAGVNSKGGFQAGQLVTEICMGGCGKAQIMSKSYGSIELPSIFICSDKPVIATLGSQYAGWQISEGGYFAIGSGPARALALKPKDIYEEIGYADSSSRAVVVLETEKNPPQKLVDQISKDCKIATENLAIILTPTTSVAGAVQVAGRVVETGIHKLRKIGLDPRVISHAWGIAPIPPSTPKFAVAMARTNDAILYGGTAYYTLDFDDEKKLEHIMENAPSGSSEDSGRPFMEIFKEAEYDFYKIDPNLFAPAVITVNNAKTGKVFTRGRINNEILRKSLGV